ncbi:hypothetical protein NLU13_4369 [Sarocladium strictum]|uniref:Uncharacterized protein n=1 Tax=Sarocladium strictum TaxID=5046 RepID=A0AA39GIS0_SARSR|nr:hypothetical protein NLU13_4369 [Sarocladium strictum]
MSSQRTMEKERNQSPYGDSAAESTAASSAEEQQPQRKKKSRKSKKDKSGGGSGPLSQLPTDSLPGVGEVGSTASNALGGVTGALGGVTGGALSKGEGGGDEGGKSDTLRLRLDLNLEIEIQLKARIHGDLELALLN